MPPLAASPCLLSLTDPSHSLPPLFHNLPHWLTAFLLLTDLSHCPRASTCACLSHLLCSQVSQSEFEAGFTQYQTSMGFEPARQRSPQKPKARAVVLSASEQPVCIDGIDFSDLIRGCGCTIGDTAERAISLEQFRALMKHAARRFEEEKSWEVTRYCGERHTTEYITEADQFNLYDCNAHIIMKVTQHRKCALVETLATGAQAPDYFVSTDVFLSTWRCLFSFAALSPYLISLFSFAPLSCLLLWCLPIYFAVFSFAALSCLLLRSIRAPNVEVTVGLSGFSLLGRVCGLVVGLLRAAFQRPWTRVCRRLGGGGEVGRR